MKFSCMIWPHSGNTLEPVIRLAQLAEECGFETAYLGDSQMIWHDVWVALGACAAATSRIRLGPGVSNPVTRHPAVTANAINSLNILSEGRAVLGIGAGDSSVRTAGLSPAKLNLVRERIEFIRALLDGEEVLIGAEGDVFKKRYKIIRIGLNSIVVEDMQFEDQQELKLQEGPA